MDVTHIAAFGKLSFVHAEVKGENGEVEGIFDLSGRKVENPTTGIYIVNNKKVYIK